MEILIILACVPLYIINSFCDKYVSSKDGNRHVFLYNTVKFAVGTLILLPLFLFDQAPRFTPGVLICGILCGILYAASKVLILRGYATTSVAFMTLCHSAGMIIPCILGHFLWSEPIGIFAFIGILLTVLSALLLKDAPAATAKFKLSGILIGVIIFLSSGGVMVLQKCMGIYFKGDSVNAYNFYSFIFAAVILTVFVKPAVIKERGELTLPKMCLAASGSAISLCVISLVMTSLAGKVPSVLMFPLFNGLGIILVCIGSVFVFREKMTPKKLLGLAIGVVGLCLVNIK